jgi:nucleotide-binding universal stress UspA family protein
MSVKTILVPLDGGELSDTILESALIVARNVDGHIEGLHIRARSSDALSFGMRYIPSNLQNMVVKEAEDDAREKADQVREAFERFCTQRQVPMDSEPGTGGVSAAWREESGRISDVLVHRAQLFDLSVVSFPRMVKGHIRQSPLGGNLEALLLESGRPIMMVPAQPPRVIGSRIVIGWNASAESARVVGDAMWSLQAAEAVTVLTNPSRLQSAEQLCRNLAWHGVRATVRNFEAESRAVGAALLAEAKAVDADLMVVGGYSHARARELLLGGATRHLLAAADLPILMAH